MPIILLRNLTRSAGLMNGSCLVVTACLRYGVQATILTGTWKGSSVCIPRINLTPAQEAELGLHFIRRQLPIKLAYCITVNISQDQTLKVVGLLLKVSRVLSWSGQCGTVSGRPPRWSLRYGSTIGKTGSTRRGFYGQRCMERSVEVNLARDPP